jgi:F-type H+-transporting ATPase subunit delta
MGILSKHVPSLLQLRPSLLEVKAENSTKSYFGKYLILLIIVVSGGFASMNADNSLNISAMEALPIDQIDVNVNYKFAVDVGCSKAIG